MTRPWTASRGLRPPICTDVRVLDDTNARVNYDWRGYLLKLLTVVLVLRKPWNPLWLLAVGARRHARARVRVPAAACRRFFVDRHSNIVIEAALCRKFLVINKSVAHIT